MPIVPYEQSILARVATMGSQPHVEDEPEPESQYSGLDLAAAALRQNNVVSNAPQMFSDAVASFDDVYDKDFDPLSAESVAGYEQFAERFINSASTAESQRIKDRIDAELADRKVIQEAGGAGLASSIAAGLVDPITLASMAMPMLGAGTRAQRILKGMATSVAFDSAQEAVLHGQQSLRTFGESVINVGAGALLTGALGTLATRISKKDFGTMTEEVKRWTAGLAPEIESTGGAARVGFGTTLEDETVAKGGEAILKTAGKINPLARVMQSSSKRARILMQELADVPFLLNKHLKGVATPRSAEGEIKAEQATRYQLIKATDAAWREHKAAGGILQRGEFAEQVAGALRRGDKAADPAVEKVAQSYRKFFDDSRKALQNADLIEDPVKADQTRLENEAVEKYVKAESSQIYSDYSARTNATVQPSEFRRLLRTELSERSKSAGARAAVSEAPEPVREFADTLVAHHEVRQNLEAQLESKLSTIENTKQVGIDKAEVEAEAARKAYVEARSAIGQGRPRPGDPEAAHEPVPAPRQEHEVALEESDRGRSITLRTPSGFTEARVSGGEFLQVIETETAEGARQTGEGSARMRRLMQIAEERGLTLISDTKVSPSAARFYERASADGFDVIRNAAKRDGDGNLISEDSRPVFEIRPGKAGYSGAQGELTDEQLATFQGLRSDVPTDEVVGGPRARESGQSGVEGASGARGEPLKVFRGSLREIDEREFRKGSVAPTTRPMLGLGAHFTNSPERAADLGQVTEHLLDIRNPKIIQGGELPGFRTSAEYQEYAQKLRAEGFDGLVIDGSHFGGPVDFFAFDPAQVLSKTKKARAARSDAPKPMTRERRTIESMKLRSNRDQALRAARKMREAEQQTAAKAARAARKEHADAIRKAREALQEQRAKAVKKFQSAAAVDEKSFTKRAEKAAKTGDDDLLEDVNKLAELYRNKDRGQLASRVVVPKTRVTDAPLGAKSYLPRLWDHHKIRTNRIAFEDTLRDWFGRQSDIAPEEVNSAVADVIDTVNGSLRDHAQIATGFVGKTGSLKSRVLNVPDEVLEPWLVNDIEKIMDSYIRTVTPQLVVKRKFGELDMRQQMQDVRDEYAAMRERATTNEAKAAITDEMEATLADIQGVRDLLMGKYGKPADPDSMLVKTGRAVRAWNYVRSLGGQVFSSFPDAGRVVARHGLVKTAKTISRLVSDAKFRNLTTEEAHRAGTALEWVLNTRADTLAEIGDEMVSSRVDKILRRESNRFSRLTGMASWNTALKTLAVALEQDAIIRAAKGGSLSKFQRGQLASLGIGGRMMERVGEQLSKHAEDTDGLLRSNVEAWTDLEAAQAFEGAILKSADQVVMTKGVADVPLFMSKDLGRTLFQFKSFGMASVNRLLVPMAQGIAHGDLATLNGAWMMMALGAMANAARDYAAGYEPVTDPSRIAVEAFDRAGFTSFLAEPIDLVSGTFGGPRFGRFTSTTPGEQILGPAIGAVIDVQQTMQKAFTEGGEFAPGAKASDIYRFRKLLPYQNLFYLRRLINALEGEFSEGVGAEGAGTKSFGERVSETKALNRN